MKIAVLADIHGNVRALSAVLADLSRRCVQRVVNLGDCLYGPFDPRPVADRLIEAGWPTVSGNEDRCLVDAADGAAESRTAHFTLDQLSKRHIDWLRGLPKTKRIKGIAVAFHGTPTKDTIYLLHQPSEDGTMHPVPKQQIADQLEGIAEQLVVCAHDHLPRVVKLEDGRTVINPGSVGCPAYTDDAPIPHTVETGSPHARYALVTWEEGAVSDTELLAVSYDWEAAAAEADRNGFHEWAKWIATGRAA